VAAEKDERAQLHVLATAESPINEAFFRYLTATNSGTYTKVKSSVRPR